MPSAIEHPSTKRPATSSASGTPRSVPRPARTASPARSCRRKREQHAHHRHRPRLAHRHEAAEPGATADADQRRRLPADRSRHRAQVEKRQPEQEGDRAPMPVASSHTGVCHPVLSDAAANATPHGGRPCRGRQRTAEPASRRGGPSLYRVRPSIVARWSASNPCSCRAGTRERKVAVQVAGSSSMAGVPPGRRRYDECAMTSYRTASAGTGQSLIWIRTGDQVQMAVVLVSAPAGMRVAGLDGDEIDLPCRTPRSAWISPAKARTAPSAP